MNQKYSDVEPAVSALLLSWKVLLFKEIVVAITLDQVSVNLQKISQFIQQHESLLQEEGVWRVNGEAKTAQSFVTNLIKDGVIDEHENIVTVTDGVKLLLKEHGPLTSAQGSQEVLIKAMTLAQNKEETKQLQAVKLFDDFVHELARSNSKENIQTAHVIHTLFFLCMKTAKYQGMNQMSAQNLGITPLGPFLMNQVLVNIKADQILILTSQASTLCSLVLEHNQNAKARFDKPFSERLKNLRDRAQENSKAMVKKSYARRPTVLFTSNSKALDAAFKQDKTAIKIMMLETFIQHLNLNEAEMPQDKLSKKLKNAQEEKAKLEKSLQKKARKKNKI